MKLRTIIITLALISLIATIAGGYLITLSLKSSAHNQVNREASNTANEIAAEFDTEISFFKRASMTLAGHEQLYNALIRSSPSSITTANRVLDLFNESLGADVTYLMDDSGTTLASSNRNMPGSFVGRNYSFRPYFLEAVKGNTSVYMALGVTSKKRGIYFSVPVTGGSRVPAGVAVIKSGLEWIEDDFAKDYTGALVLADPHGVIFISSRDDWLYKTVSDISDEERGEIAGSRQFGNLLTESTGLKLTDDGLAYDMDGTEFHIHSAALKNYPGWKVIYFHDHEKAVSLLSAPVYRMASIIIFILCVIVAVSVYILVAKAEGEIRERKELQHRLRMMAITDELTGLYNRRGFFKLAAHRLNMANRDKRKLCLFYLDLDGLKQINDKMGHKFGDAALRDTGEILRSVFRKSDIVARIGGDEFTALMTCDTQEESKAVRKRLMAGLRAHRVHKKRTFVISLSIGELMYDPASPRDFEEFFHEADELMYRQKRKRKKGG